MAKLRECMIIWETAPDVWHALAFDAVKTEGHTGEQVITKYPVSRGFQVSEHSIRQNSIVTLDVVVSNISMPSATVRQSYEAAFKSLCSSAGGSASLDSAIKWGRLEHLGNNIDLFPDQSPLNFVDNLLSSATGEVSSLKVDNAFNQIVKLNRTGLRCHVLTMRGMYLNCSLKNYSAINSVNDSYCLVSTLTFEQHVVVNDIQQGSVLAALSDSDGTSVLDDLLGVFG